MINSMINQENGEDTSSDTSSGVLENTRKEASCDTDTAPIVDMPGLFQYSGLVDSMRESLKTIMRLGSASEDTTKMFLKQYLLLRARLKETLRADLKAETDLWAYDLEEVTIENLYMASCMLSKWMDVLHQTPNFLFGLEMQKAQQVSLSVQARKALGGTVQFGNMPLETVQASGTGQYL